MRILILLTVLTGCTTPPLVGPIVEPIEKEHSGSVSETVSKYRSLLVNDGWKLEASNVSTSDGFLKAVKSYDKIMLYSLPISLTVSCNQSSNKVNCVTTVSASNQGPIQQRVLQNREFMEFLDELRLL